MKPILFLSVLAWALVACGPPPPPRSAETSSAEAVVIDVRTRAEYEAGHIDGALLIPHDVIAERIAAAVPDTARQVILYCRSGRRAAMAEQTLRELGYTHVVNAGGLAAARRRLEE